MDMRGSHWMKAGHAKGGDDRPIRELRAADLGRQSTVRPFRLHFAAGFDLCQLEKQMKHLEALMRLAVAPPAHRWKHVREAHELRRRLYQ